MYIKKIIILTVLICCIAGNGFTQNMVRPLVIGEKVPDVLMKEVINYGQSSVRISDFKGKLLILDFWATWCHWCIEAFPKADSLQKQFGKKMQILLVDCRATKDNEGKVSWFYKDRLIKYKDFKLPSVYMDTVLIKMFPHELIPHYIWINKDGIVMAVTDEKEVTAANIQMILDGKDVQLRAKTQ